MQHYYQNRKIIVMLPVCSKLFSSTISYSFAAVIDWAEMEFGCSGCGHYRGMGLVTHLPELSSHGLAAAIDT